MSYADQIILLFVLAIPIASVAWTVTHEEVFREARELAVRRSKSGRTIWERKFFYLFTCEFCFSHYVTLAFLLVTRYTLVYPDWRGYLVAFFSLVWVANVYMSFFGRLRLEIKAERVDIKVKEEIVGNGGVANGAANGVANGEARGGRGALGDGRERAAGMGEESGRRSR